MLNLLLSLPEPNLVTFLFLLDHLKRCPLHPTPLHTNLNTVAMAQETGLSLSLCCY